MEMKRVEIDREAFDTILHALGNIIYMDADEAEAGRENVIVWSSPRGGRAVLLVGASE